MKKIYSAAIASLFSLSAVAQNNLGVSTGNWGGTTGLYLNPANAANNKYKLYIDVATVMGGFDNSLGTLKTRGGLIGAINNGDFNDIVNYTAKDKFSMLAPYAEVRGPGALINFQGKHNIALTTRVRGINQFNNFDKLLFQTITDPNFTSGNIDLTSKNFNYTAHMWSEIGLTYGTTLVEQPDFRLKAGVTLRYLGGIGYEALRGNNLDAHLRASSDSFYATNSDIEYASNILSATDALSNGLNNNSILHQFFSSKAGWGIGGDAGLVFELLNTNHSCRKDYLLRVSASVIDIGSIKYKAKNNFNALATGNGYITGEGLLNNVRGFDDFVKYASQQGFNVSTAQLDTRLYMPTRLIVGVDYNMFGDFYVNGTFAGNLAYRQNFGNSFYNQFTITPRYDTKWLSVGLPITYSALTSNLRVGLGVRFSGFFVGSDDALGLMFNKQYGVNFYIGGFVPLNMHRGPGCHMHKSEEKTTSKDDDKDMDEEREGKADSTDNSFNYKYQIRSVEYAKAPQNRNNQSNGNNSTATIGVAAKDEYIERH